MNLEHIPVMPDQVVKFLKAESGGTFLDCTFGSGGHTRKILEANPVNRVVALDRDSEALKRGSRFLGDMKERLELKQLAFSEIGRELSNRNFNGILADLGLSTDQLKSGRGFSFSDDTPLDMRMDQSQQLSADDIVNTYSQSELERVLKEGGATHSARQLASAIVQSRPINNTSSLASIVRKVLAGKFPARKKIDPATVVFQAIRIAVNDELNELRALLDAIPALAAEGARLAVITFHSLEDKIVVRKMREWEGERVPALWPGADSQAGIGRIVQRKAITASDAEVSINPAARSARLRVFEFSH